MAYNEKARLSIMRWRANNVDKYREMQKLYQRERYRDDYESTRKVQKQKMYMWKKQTQIMLNMLNNLVPI
jgi:hypothetical protein